jgi:glutamate-ammonia-ligase adenylyltransferase
VRTAGALEHHRLGIRRIEAAVEEAVERAQAGGGARTRGGCEIVLAAAAGEPLTLSTLQALGQDPILAEAWRIQQRLAQLLAAAFEGRVDPEAEPAVFQQRLAEAAGALDFESLKTRLTDLRAQARRAFEQAVPAGRDGESPDPRSTS